MAVILGGMARSAEHVAKSASRFKLVADDFDHRQQRRGEQTAADSPQPTKEEDRKDDRQRRELQRPAKHHRRDEIAFNGRDQSKYRGGSSAPPQRLVRQRTHE